MNALAHDLLIVGGGGAGLRAAIAAAEAHPDLTIGLLSKVYPMRSHTVSAEGGAAAVMREEDSLDSHAFDTIKGSDFLADQDAVEAFVQEAAKLGLDEDRVHRLEQTSVAPGVEIGPVGPKLRFWSSWRTRRERAGCC